MENRTRIAKQEIIKYVMNAVIVLLCVILLVAIGMTVEEAGYYFGMPNKADYFENYVYCEDYALMVDSYYENIAEGYEGNKAMKEYYGVAKYFEAASYYKVYLELGDTDRAERELAKMDAAYDEMGGWCIMQPDIHEKLGLKQPDES